MPIENIPSVLSRGILCFEEAKKFINHISIANEEVQEKRDKKIVPNGLRLHQYANLYFTYHNPMMYVKKNEAENLCILVISSSVLDIDGCVVSDRNAASSYVRFYSPIDGVEMIDFEKVFAEYWLHDNYYEWVEHRAIKCAEILIPNYIPFKYIEGAYVLDNNSMDRLLELGFYKQIAVNRSVFFR